MFARTRSGARGVTYALVGLLTATSLAPLPTLAQESPEVTGQVSGYYDQNGVWVEEYAVDPAVQSAPVATTGYVDQNGNWVDTTGQAASAESTGYLDQNGNWVDTTGQAVAAETTGYVDQNGNWVDTAVAAPVETTGYTDQNGNWVDTTGQAAPAETTGYVDQNGNWVDTTAQAAPAETTGYVDQNGVWVDTTGQAAPAETTGYVDQNGNWVDTTGQAAPSEITGYTDQNGNWVDTTGQAQAAPVAEATGYYDQNGVWVDTTGQTTQVSGYYDQNGVWVEPAADPATQAPAVTQSTGYYDQNGVWVDTSNSGQANGTVVYNNSAGQSNTSSAPAAAPIGTAYIGGTNGDGAICRSGADWASAELGTIPEGSAVEVTGGTVGEWQPVNCNGVSGYVHASFVSWDQTALAASTTDTTVVEAPRRNRNRRGNNNNNNANVAPSGGGQSLVNFASGYLGYPYVYAGAGPSGFDCSGFTMFVVQNTLGIDISHSVPTQYSMGTPVSQSQLQPGDLVFFENTFSPGLSHVGIYIGNGQFIHSENESTGVVISDLNSDYYASHYYGAVRLA